MAYQYKIYNTAGTLQSEISPATVVSDCSFSKTVGSGLGEMKVRIKTDFDTSYTIGYIVKVVLFNYNYPNGKLIYSGVIHEIYREATNSEIVILRLLGSASIFSYVVYRQGGVTGSQTQDPAEFIRQGITGLNTIYNYFTYTGTSVVNRGYTLYLSYAYTPIKTIFDTIAKASNAYLYVDENNEVNYKSWSGTADHIFTYGKDIISIESENDTQDLANRVYYRWASGTQTRDDAGSQATYGLREKTIVNVDVGNSGSADRLADDYLSNFANALQKTTIEVASNYPIEDISPGQTCRIVGLDTGLPTVLKIVRVSYSTDKATLDIESYTPTVTYIRG